MANLLPSGTQELSVAEDATSFTISGILLELSDVLPGDELCVSGASAPILALDDSGTHTLGIPWPGSTIVDSTSWWIRRVSDQRYSGFFTAQQASRVQTHFARALALGLPYKVLSEANTPPGSPEEGDTHLIGTSPTGAWASNAKNIATWANGAWVFAAPQIGDTATNVATNVMKVYAESLDWETPDLDGSDIDIDTIEGTDADNAQDAFAALASGAGGGFRNVIINGGMDIDDVNAGAAVNFDASWTYGVNMWSIIAGAAVSGTLTAQRVSGVSTPYCMQIARSSGSFASNLVAVQVVESDLVRRLQGETCLASFSAWKGSAYAASLGVVIAFGTAADQGRASVLGGWTGYSAATTYFPALTTSETEFSFEFDVPSDALEMAMIFDTGAFAGSGGANDWLKFTKAMIEKGTMRHQFEPRPLAVEDDLCARYLRYENPGAVIPMGSGYMSSTTNARVFIPTKSRFRTTPSIAGAVANMRCYAGSSPFTPSAIAVVSAQKHYAAVDATVTGATANNPTSFALTGSGTLTLDARLS